MGRTVIETSALVLLHAGRFEDPGPNRDRRDGPTQGRWSRAYDNIETLGLWSLFDLAGRRADTRGLACLLVAAALWRLREDDVISLQDVSRIDIPHEWPKPRGLLQMVGSALKDSRKRGDLDLLDIRVTAKRPDSSRAGVEKAIVEVLDRPDSPDERHVATVATDTWRRAIDESGRKGTSAPHAVIGLALDAALEAGAVVEASDGDGDKIVGRRIQSDLARLHAFDDEAEKTQAAWTRFCRDEHNLAAGLIETIHHHFPNGSDGASSASSG